MKRRIFLRSASLAILASGLPLAKARAATTRRFTIDLTPGAVGVGARGIELLDLAKEHGFESVQPNPGFLLEKQREKKLGVFVGQLKDRNLRWGAAALPVDFRQDEDAFQKGLETLPQLAAALQEAGATRVGTWLKPFHPSLTYLANFKQHVARLGEVNRILADHGLRFGLEYVGTRTLWTSQRHAFIHTMAETRELIAEIDQPGLGLVLDSWHWFTAGETADHILALDNRDVVACDLNDAPAGIPVEEQQDNRRELPAATGVIDIASFLDAVARIGYDGPVRAEPFNQPLRKLDDGPAAKATADAIRKAIEMAGL